MLQNLARAIVLRYPSAWRERYADEVLDLIDSAPVRVYDVGELFRNMLVEQVRATVDLERPSEAAARVLRWKMITVGIAVFLTFSAALLLLWWRRLSEPEAERVLLPVLVFWLALLGVWAIHKWHQRHRAKDERAPFPVWLAVVCLPVHLLATTCWLWARFSYVSEYSPVWLDWLQNVYHTVYLGSLTTWLMMQIWPGQRLVQVLTEFQMADSAVDGARGYIASCEEWIAKGVPSPLSDAQVALEQRIRERDAILERLNAADSRKRFSQPS